LVCIFDISKSKFQKRDEDTNSQNEKPKSGYFSDDNILDKNTCENITKAYVDSIYERLKLSNKTMYPFQ